MTTKVNDVYAAGQFVTASVTHFTITKTGMAEADLETIYKTVASKATPILVGAIDGNDVRVAVENNGSWTAADMDTALGGDFSVADFAY
jgi:hypothetical protein